MRKIIFTFCLLSFIGFLATQTKAQQPVSQSERQTVIKALEAKIAELEVKRAVDLSSYNPTTINEQLINLRKRLSELIGKRRSVTKRRTIYGNTVVQNKRKPKV